MAVFQDVIDSIANFANGRVQGVDVAAVLDSKAAGQTDQLEWRYSIVDLMKVLGLPGDLSSRIALARELGYSGALNGSAEMNIWLHKQILTKLDEAGAIVPADLKD
jgi:hypothetical protein